MIDLIYKQSSLLNLFARLQEVSGRNEKQRILALVSKEDPNITTDDLVVIQECLDGKHPLGYTFPITHGEGVPDVSTLRQVIELLEKPIKEKNLSQANINATVEKVNALTRLLEPVVNKSLRLGIRLAEDSRSFKPMLASNARDCFDETIDYIIQEKLDGNRCIASFDEGIGDWIFTSRNGKPLNVKFDMGLLPKGYVYDGEILTSAQTFQSILREEGKFEVSTAWGNEFQSLSGRVNSNKAEDKDSLVYNIYDIMLDQPCTYRQAIIDSLRKYENHNHNFRFVRNLGRTHTHSMKAILDNIVKTKGEGLILRDPNAPYIHDRCKALLKVKQMQSMDMECFDTEKGTGRNADRIGKLVCRLTTSKGEYIEARVGSGLKDEDRLQDPSYFIGKIVEVQYFEITKAQGREGLSLRHPVYLGIRTDKDTTSEY